MGPLKCLVRFGSASKRTLFVTLSGMGPGDSCVLGAPQNAPNLAGSFLQFHPTHL